MFSVWGDHSKGSRRKGDVILQEDIHANRVLVPKFRGDTPRLYGVCLDDWEYEKFLLEKDKITRDCDQALKQAEKKNPKLY